MDFYWIYDFSNIGMFFLITIFFVVLSLMGPAFLANTFRRIFDLDQESNSHIGNIITVFGAFFGITLGLIAVGVFENFNGTGDKVTSEAAALTALYRDVSIMKSPQKEELKTLLKAYTQHVIDDDWPLQKKGIIPKRGTEIINMFQADLANYKPVDAVDEWIFGEVFNQFNVLIEKRRLRLDAVTGTKLPSTIWMILVMGALIQIIIFWLLRIDNKKIDYLVNGISGLLLGTMLFLIVAMDNPFRGAFSVGPESFEIVYNGLMSGK